MGCGRAFIGKKGSVDYHHEMNATHFEEWLAEVQMKIPNCSIIFIDQTSYHRRISDETKNPTANWRKSEVIDWLERNNITVPEPYSAFHEATLPVLRQLCKENRKTQKFVVEEMVENCGKDVKLLWLPVAHCELNADELIWSHVKGEVARCNKTFKIKDVLPLCQEKLQNTTPELWAKCEKHVIDLENKIMEKEKIAEEFLGNERHKILIQLNGSDEDESDSSEDSEDEN